MPRVALRGAQIGALLAVAALSGAHAPHAARHAHHTPHPHPAMPSAAHDAPIIVTINPEARVSVRRGGELPLPAHCGQAMALPVKIVNAGFSTAPLQAWLVDRFLDGVSLEFPATPLTGQHEERRTLRVVLDRPGPTDLTIAFRERNGLRELGGRDRIHLLLQCRPASAHPLGRPPLGLQAPSAEGQAQSAAFARLQARFHGVWAVKTLRACAHSQRWSK